MVKKKGSSSDVMVQHKERPKIKIIHIIAPEIIKTDVANFRDLVQRLTGKQNEAAAAAGGEEEEEKKEETIITKKRQRPAVEKNDQLVQEENCNKKIKCEVKVEEGGFGYDHLDQNDLWMDLNPGGFLNFLEEDGYMAADLFQSPLGSMSRMDFVGEMYAS
uniref:VQ domain-containing protein n=1 Tax=Leersia perrieri TaxID=77586 RepID=A0A0D9WS61_9ORYZ